MRMSAHLALLEAALPDVRAKTCQDAAHGEWIGFGSFYVFERFKRLLGARGPSGSPA